MILQEATMKALQGKLEEAKGTDKLFTCIEDRQGGTWAVGRTMTAEEWGELASSWADSDDWENPDEPLLKNFDTEEACIAFIDDMWEITIVPSDDPEAKALLDEGWFNKKSKDKKEPTTTADDHPELAELIKARNMTRVGKDGWEMPQDDKEIKNEDKLNDDKLNYDTALEKIYEYYKEKLPKQDFFYDLVNYTSIDVKEIRQWYNDVFKDGKFGGYAPWL